MSDTTNRPKPRPRPRPVPKKVTSDSNAALPTGAASSSNQRLDGADDDFFIKNRNRVLPTRKIHAKKESVIISDEDSASDSEEVSPGSKKRRKVSGLAIPSAQRSADSIGASSSSTRVHDDSDSGIELVGEGESNPRRASRRNAKKVRRARSRSITPPPMLPLRDIEKVKKVVRDSFNKRETAPASESDNESDASEASVELNPALQRIETQVNRNASSTPAVHSSNSFEYDGRASLPPPVDQGEVEIKVRWHEHPNVVEQRRARGENAQPETHEYKISRGDDFGDLFNAIAEDVKTPLTTLVVCYTGKRVFSSVKPSTLNIWRTAEFDAYAKPVFEYIRSNDFSHVGQPTPRSSPSKQRTGRAINLSDDDEITVIPSAGPSTSAHTQPQPANPSGMASGGVSQDADEDGDSIQLVLRSGAPRKDISLKVRTTAKCGNIVKAFLRRADLAKDYPHICDENYKPPAAPPPPGRQMRARGRASAAAAAAAPAAPSAPLKYPKLYIDGDKMDDDTPIGDMDLEDGDLVEVVDL